MNEIECKLNLYGKGRTLMKKRIISIFLIFMLVSMNICNAQDTLSNEQVQALLTGYVNENAPTA